MEDRKEELKCPHCGQVFKIDESGYAQILRQVHDEAFRRELEARLREAKTTAEAEKKAAVSEAVRENEKKVIELQGLLNGKEQEIQLRENNLKEQFALTLKLKDDEIAQYRDFKTRLSTKMVGESLERHCHDQFDAIRATAFPNAYFEKDNDDRTGSKGDFVFRESDAEGTEFVSIMFEMKNEMDATEKKHRNEDFFRELDKDRREKNCEYAVLVSLLEKDSELYNAGIVDVSHRYEKMYVVRPQCFIPIITLLRNASLKSLRYKKELQIVRNQQIDIQHFEDRMNDFKKRFGDNYRLASEKFKAAIDDIDKSIRALEKTKADLLASENNLRLANDKAQDLTIRKLTKDSPSLKEAFKEAKNSR